MALIIEFKTTWRPAERTEGSAYQQENKIQRGYKLHSNISVLFCSPSPELIILMMQTCTFTDYLSPEDPQHFKNLPLFPRSQTKVKQALPCLSPKYPHPEEGV